MNEIRIKNSDWLFNCGILGLYNILTYNNDKRVILLQDELIFPVSRLENFEEKYFSYLISIYEKTFSMYRITSFETFLRNHEETNFENFNTASLEQLNFQIEQVKKYLKSNSYISAYKAINSAMSEEEKKKIKESVPEKN